MTLLRLLLALAMLALAPAAKADDLRPGYLELTETAPDTWRIVWKAPVRGGLATMASPELPADCTPTPATEALRGGALVRTWTARCAGGLAGKSVALSGLDLLFTDALVRVAPADRLVQAARLTPDAPVFTVSQRPERGAVARTYFGLGVEHILLGFDHLLFVVALVILQKGAWRVAATVTAFTIAHSLTLVATSLDLVSVPRAPVEAVIALSIMFVAVEIVKARPGDLRLSERFPWIVAFLFGLLHGFGFAGALAEIGLPEGEVPVALLTFNLGVEAGQLAIVAVSLVALLAIQRLTPVALRPLRVGAAYGIGSIASFWFIERLVA